MVRRTPQGIRIKTRNDYDWTERYPQITEAASRLSATSFVIDGEGVILRQDGVSDFDRMHSRRYDREVQFLGFDLLELDGTDLRREPLENRKATLASLLRRSPAGIQLVEHLEAEDGRHRVRSRLPPRPRGYRQQAPRCTISIRPQWHMAQGEEPRAPGNVSRLGGSVLMTPGDARFEIRVDGVVRSYRDIRDNAIEAARFLQQRHPGAEIVITDLRDGSAVPFERPANRGM